MRWREPDSHSWDTACQASCLHICYEQVTQCNASKTPIAAEDETQIRLRCLQDGLSRRRSVEVPVKGQGRPSFAPSRGSQGKQSKLSSRRCQPNCQTNPRRLKVMNRKDMKMFAISGALVWPACAQPTPCSLPGCPTRAILHSLFF